MYRYYFNYQKNTIPLKCTLLVHAHATSPFFTQTISLISTLRTEIFNKGAISLEDRFSLRYAQSSHWELMTNELLLSFQEFFICVLKASLKTLQESFPVLSC
jgi:hypothetical protein